ncbi:hypothetical protein F4801DRAFT_199439 [Xylaria longipes]|nr:hypothetical protein F4801DRAFT_199439 [Xylaria longipes]RYC57478.1 hypothetical protein CHU98_g8744 [Xylaria longipes]
MATSIIQPDNQGYYAQYLVQSSTFPQISNLERNGTVAPIEAEPGFPVQYTGERVWSGSEMLTKQHDWIIDLSEEDQNRILEALRHFQSLKVGPETLTTETFPLPQNLAKRLRLISSDCYNGRGFAILRGIQPEKFTEEENVLVFAGISSYVAPKRGFQDINRESVICHVVSEQLKPGADEKNLRPAFTNGRLTFHTDLGEILTLYTLDISESAGETMIVSSSYLYNELAKTRPDLLHEFNEKWACFHSQDYNKDGTPIATNAPGDKLVFQYSRLPTTGFGNLKANETLPSPSPKLLEAMSVLEDLALKHALPLPRQRGDIVYFNNLCLMHGRKAFDLDTDGRPLLSKRHLVKLMLQDPEFTWDIPGSMGTIMRRVYGPNRDDGGREEKWQLSLSADNSLSGQRRWAGEGSVSNG